MLFINSVNFELPQMGKEPKVGFEDEYVEKKMISGMIKRIYTGRRFKASFSYAFLTDGQRKTLYNFLSNQRERGYVDVVVSTPDITYSGQAILELNGELTRFKYDSDSGEYVWTNWQMSLKGVACAN